MAVIGIDFGNVNSFPAFVKDMDERTRTGGTELSLLPADMKFNSGIPTTYFYSAKKGEKFGHAATTVPPRANQRNLLKRRFDTKEVIDGKEILYDEVITKMIEHIVRLANDTMQKTYLQTTNLISLAYPVEFTHAQLMHLVRLAEAATLEDGRHVKVAGTIREPAAAALAYLCSIKAPKDNYNVLVYDLGGGTFDVASVTAHLRGNPINGNVEYYDVVNMDGLKIGGHEFNQAMYDLFIEKAEMTPTGGRKDQWMTEAEHVKIELSEQEVAYPQIIDENGEPIEIEISRAEYEDRVRDLVQRTVNCTVGLLTQPGVPTPDLILLTGGQSQMPLIRQLITKSFPNFPQDKIIIYKPQQAIACGAARYGVLEKDPAAPARPTGVGFAPAPRVKQKTRFAIGVCDILDASNRKHVDILIPAGTELPTPQSAWQVYALARPRMTDSTQIVEAVKKSPNLYNQDTDFQRTMNLVLNFKEQKPAGYRIELSIYVDEKGILHAIVRDSRNHSLSEHATFQLQNLQ